MLRELFGIAPKTQQLMCPSDRDLHLAALHNLDLPFFSEFFPKSDAELDAGQRWVNAKREWLKTIEDRRVRKAYAGWIEYVQTRLNDNRTENRTGAERKAYEKRRAETESEWARGRDLASILPKPSN